MSKEFYYFTPIKDIVAVRTNKKDFSFSYGMAMPASNQESYNKSLIKLTLDIVSGLIIPEKDEKSQMGKFHYFSGFPGKKEMFYERSFVFKRKLQFKISGIDTNNIKVTVNKDYMRFVKHRFMNIHSMGYILTDIINLRLLHNRLAPLHCSGIVVDNDCYVIFAPPNTGKTLTAMSLCMKNKDRYKFIAEDLAITDSVNLFAAPWTSTFRYYDSVDTSKFSKFLNNLTEKVSFLELFSFGKTEPITKYVDDVVHKAKIKGIYILDRGKNESINISEKEAFDRINTLDRYEFNYMRAPSIIAYEYFNRETDIESAYEMERTLLKKMVSSANFVKVISTENALTYADLIESDLDK